MNDTPSHLDDVADRYLDLMKGCLTRYLFIDEEPRSIRWGWRRTITQPLKKVLGPRGVLGAKRLLRPLMVDEKARRARFAERREPTEPTAKPPVARPRLRLVKLGGDRRLREVGCDWPPYAETMVGLRRIEHVQACVTDVVREGVPGDLIEAGVWRGGTTVFMRAVLAALGDTSRRVWVADSFRGLPTSDARRYPADARLDLWMWPELSVSLDQVKANFVKYGLLDDQVEFLVGWFKDTLATAPIDRLAVIRLDGDLYESTMDSLVALYPKLSMGGYLIVDDYGTIGACQQAVADYRTAPGITEEITPVDWTAVYWQRQR